MNIKEFNAGGYKQQYRYKSFMPSSIHHEWQISDSNLILLLSKADSKLGELNAFSQLIPDIDFFIKMHVNKEATSSSRIEGTQTNIEEALQKIESIDPERRDDWIEVQNYITAMNEAVTSLEQLPISSRLLKNTHQILLQGVRGQNKQPGEFRKSQNWIGGASINDAVFIPPYQEDVLDLMADLEHFLNDETHPIPHLIRIAIAHYQFETIHPFLDGNGRIGRLLITLYLVSKGLLTKPTLYLSDFFEKHKSLYYDNLTRVRTHNDMTQWIKFFLEGVYQISENSIETFKSIISLRHDCENKIFSLGKKTKLAQNFLNNLYKTPVVYSQDVATTFSISLAAALRLIDDFVRLEILHEITGYKRNRVFVFSKYIKLFE
ncbi:cell filamentation protein Fic [Gammaproteobacteria bacterium SCGC AG-212-F23]|nr:cell filamentation protein Fic [Gammaproteobacteria bacterium SCGC AG-212-F23]